MKNKVKPNMYKVKCLRCDNLVDSYFKDNSQKNVVCQICMNQVK